MAIANKHKVIGAGAFTINGLTEDLTPDTAADYLATYDASAGKNKKVLLSNLGLGGGGNAFTIFQTPYGTAPTADSLTDTLTFESADNSVYISGNSTTDTINLQISPIDLIVTSSTAANHPLIARGVLAQTANTFEVQKSTSAIFFYANETNIKSDVIFGLGQYATGSLPTASSWEGYLAYDSTTNEVKFSDGSAWAAFGGGGGTTDVIFTSSLASTIPLTLKGSISQTADLFRVEDSSSTELLNIKPTGQVQVPLTSLNGLCGLGDTYRGIKFKNADGATGEVAIYGGTSSSVWFSQAGCRSFGTNYGFASGPNGDVLNASICWASDLDSGFYRIGSNNIAMTAGGVKGLDLNASRLNTPLVFSPGQFATGSLPAAASYEGYIAYDTTTQTMKWSNGTAWATI
jgi:hypothetical protein